GRCPMHEHVPNLYPLLILGRSEDRAEVGRNRVLPEVSAESLTSRDRRNAVPFTRRGERHFVGRCLPRDRTQAVTEALNRREAADKEAEEVPVLEVSLWEVGGGSVDRKGVAELLIEIGDVQKAVRDCHPCGAELLPRLRRSCDRCTSAGAKMKLGR